MTAAPSVQLNSGNLAGLASAVHVRCQTPSLAVAVVTPDGPDFLAGLGLSSVEEGTRCSPETNFAVASVTKTYTAALALVLHSEGRLSLDEPLSRYVPGFRLTCSNSRTQPTVRDALSHRSGLAGYEELWYNSPWSRPEILTRLSSAIARSAPQERFAYSNLMFLAAGEAIAQAAGMPYEEALQSKLLAPCGDGQSAFGSSAALPYQLAESGELQQLRQVDVGTANPALGLTGSASSLAAWMRLLLRGGNRTLPAETIRAMWTPHVEVQREDEPRIYGFYGRTRHLHYGLGWFLGEHNGLATVSHTGTLPGFRAHVALVPQAGVGVAVLANLNQTFAPEIFVYQVLDLVAGAQREDWFGHFQEVSADRQRKQLEAAGLRPGPAGWPSSLDGDALCGAFTDDVLGVVRVWRAPNGLKFSWANYDGNLEPCLDGRYRLSGVGCPLLGNDQTVEFLTKPDGAVRGLHFLGCELRRATAVASNDAAPVLACA